jgi:glycosyltransferase involved in cell wall biosynthesis
MKSVVVIPTFNEERHISDVLSKTRDYADLIVVVDSSSDRTPEIVTEFNNVMMIRSETRGKGVALRIGLEEARKSNPEYVIQMDGDGERDPSDIPAMISMSDRTGSDIVLGKRSRMRSRKRKILNLFGLWWINYLTGYDLNDTFSGMILFRKGVLDQLDLKSNGFEIESEIIVESWKHGFTVAECDVKVPNLSKSKLSRSDMLAVNTFFDIWVLRNQRTSSGIRGCLLLLAAIAGLMLAAIPYSITKA